MDKRQLHHLGTKLKHLSPWYAVALTIISAIICIFALRANNQHMITLRQAVYSADKNSGDVKGTLQSLQAYVTTHMNTNLSAGNGTVYPPIQLKYTYDRLVKAESDRVAATNKKLYTAAENYCQAKIPTGFSGRYRISCVQSYIKAHGAKAQSIPDDLYKFDFVSPRWSPDLAGWSLLAAVALALISIAAFFVRWWFRHFIA